MKNLLVIFCLFSTSALALEPAVSISIPDASYALEIADLDQDGVQEMYIATSECNHEYYHKSCTFNVKKIIKKNETKIYSEKFTNSTLKGLRVVPNSQGILDLYLEVYKHGSVSSKPGKQNTDSYLELYKVQK